jgi:hypothetical protein
VNFYYDICQCCGIAPNRTARPLRMLKDVPESEEAAGAESAYFTVMSLQRSAALLRLV